MSDADTISLQEIKSLLKADYRWKLKDGILICLGKKPGSFNWDDCGGNDFPIRIHADCLVELKKGVLAQCGEIEGEHLVRRDDLIPFCYKRYDMDCERTYRVWEAYKASRKPIRQKSDMEMAMDKPFKAHCWLNIRYIKGVMTWECVSLKRHRCMKIFSRRTPNGNLRRLDVPGKRLASNGQKSQRQAKNKSDVTK